MPTKKILIIDDSKDILEGMKMFLQLKQYSVETVHDATKGQQRITAFKPDVLFLDIYLSGVDGRELCKQIREDKDNAAMKIILFSSAANALENYEDYGADAYLEKPFGLLEIIEKIEESSTHTKKA